MNSPIERMIDAAVGLPPGWRPTFITLKCSLCESSKLVRRMEHDPEQAVLLRFPCPRCLDKLSPAYQPEVQYLDAQGNELPA